MRKDILKLLFDADDFLSGEQISERLGVSRAAVWKHIKAIKEDGAEVEAHTKRGYRLVKLPDVLKPEYIGLFTEREHDVTWLEETDSTNEYAKRQARAGAADGTIYIAELQTKGKGRLSRGWVSLPGDSVQMSMLFRPGFEPPKAPAVTFAAALGVISAVRRICGVDAKIKWPNDVVYQGKKLCGILTEMSSDMDRVEYIVCGMGLNVNQKEFPGELAQRAVSLLTATGREQSRLKLAAAMADDVSAYCSRYISGGIDAIFDEYCANSAIIGKEIRVLSGEETFSGVCRGFSKQGELLLDINGKIRAFMAGEVSIRGIGQYI
ncbi:biotin--[acetyl-CoA-carboxylase] ligase [Christensenella massiliensis]|uniref:Bifunctional ligase/repressor BirA n=1 Tax=Christensenella massiliensis TaxID=1805714 RepID=A0AAU8AB06_9FIRM